MINKGSPENEHWTLDHKSDAYTLERMHARAHARAATTQTNARANARNQTHARARAQHRQLTAHRRNPDS
eukprot:11016254-Lingulodinium_polyedra.AAC.1